MHTTTMTLDTPSDDIDDVSLAMVINHSNRSTQPSSHPRDIGSVLFQPTNKAAKAQVQDHPTKAAKAQLQDHESSVNSHMYVK
jgi:hypothetical protein